MPVDIDMPLINQNLVTMHFSIPATFKKSFCLVVVTLLGDAFIVNVFELIYKVNLLCVAVRFRNIW